MITAINQSLSDLGFGAFVKSRPPPVNPSLPPSAWQAPTRYYAGPPATTPYTPPIAQRSSLPNRSPTVNTAYTPGANYRPSTRPINFTPTPTPTVTAPVASPVALKGLPQPSQFKPPQLPGANNLGPALGAAAMLPLLAAAVGDAYGETKKLAEMAYAAGQRPGGGNLTAALAIPWTAPFALAGIASTKPRPSHIPDWLWPDPPRPSPFTLDPAAMDAGATIAPGTPPPFTGGQDTTARYRVTYQWNAIGTGGELLEPPNQQTAGGSAGYRGPIRGIEARRGANSTQLILLHGEGEELIQFSSAAQGDFANASILSNVRIDGQIDTAGDPPGGTAPVLAPNPARQSAAPTARALPSPVEAPAPSDLPWPQVAPQVAPQVSRQSAPFAEPPPARDFTATPTPDPLPPTTTAPTTTPTDLEAPSPTPPNLEKNPKTPPVDDLATPTNEPTKIVWPGLGGLSIGGASTSPLAVAIPVVLLEGLRQKLNTPSGSLTNRTAPNPNVQITKPPPPPAVSTPNPPTCIYERERVKDIQNKATDVQEKASNPVSGFPGLYGIGIESRLKIGQTFTVLGQVKSFMETAFKVTRMQKVLDMLTFIGVMHNVSMLSRNVGQTFLEVVGQGLQAAGIRDEENNVIDVNEVVGDNVEGLLKNVLGVERYEGISENWNKANRIISSASAVIWTVRSIADSTNDLMEWVAENTGRVGNALKRWRVVGENAYPDMSESAKAQNRMRTRFSKAGDLLNTTEDRLSTFSQATSGVIEVQEETSELIQNYGNFRESVINGVPDPWLPNAPVKATNDADKADSLAPEVPVSDSQKG